MASFRFGIVMLRGCPGETADQRGFASPVDDPLMPNAVDACDIGAYELQGLVAIVADLMISQTVNKTSVKQGDCLPTASGSRTSAPRRPPTWWSPTSSRATPPSLRPGTTRAPTPLRPAGRPARSPGP